MTSIIIASRSEKIHAQNTISRKCPRPPSAAIPHGRLILLGELFAAASALSPSACYHHHALALASRLCFHTTARSLRLHTYLGTRGTRLVRTTQHAPPSTLPLATRSWVLGVLSAAYLKVSPRSARHPETMAYLRTHAQDVRMPQIALRPARAGGNVPVSFVSTRTPCRRRLSRRRPEESQDGRWRARGSWWSCRRSSSPSPFP